MNSKNSILIDAVFQAILDNTRDLMFVKNADFEYVAASRSFVKMVGKKSVEEIVGRTDLEIFEDKNLAKRYMADDKKLVQGGVNLIDYMEPITDHNGQARYGSTSKYILTDEQGQFLGIFGITKDITKDYFVRQNYQKELKYLFKLPKNTYAVTYIDVDSWRIISQRKQEILGATYQTCETVEELCECALASILDRDSEASKFYRHFTQEFLVTVFESGRTQISFRYERELSDGSKHWVQNDLRFLTDVDSGHLCAMLSAKNIDEEKKEEQRLQTAAKMDKMTMVLNRETTMEYIRQIIKMEDNMQHALFMIDVDNFKSLNDTHGHREGDKFLIHLATEIKNSFRDNDIVGRIGGDEFFALMRNVSSIDMIESRANELLSTIQTVCKDYQSVNLSGSIGISVYPQNGDTLDMLYEKADAALYMAKRQGKNRVVFTEE